VPVVWLAKVPVCVVDLRIVSPNPDPFFQLVIPTQPRPLRYNLVKMNYTCTRKHEQEFFFKKCKEYNNTDSISAHFLLDVQYKSSFKYGLPELANEWSFIVTRLIIPILQPHKVDHKTIFHLQSYRVPVRED
jgi:hypothetical protein